MAVMSSNDRAAVWTDLMQQLSASQESCAIIKTDLRAAIDAADQWVSDNAASFNSALPVAARTGLTTSQKARLLAYVLMRRYVVGA